MTDDQPGSPYRRRVLAVLGTTVASGLAGCNGEMDSDGETDSPGEGTADDPDDGAETGASFDFGARRNPFFFTHEEFETFRIAFQGVELRPVDGDPVRVEADGPEFDLTELSDEDPVDLMEAAVPPDTYAELAVHLPVVEATLAEGGSVTVENADPHVLEIGAGSREIAPETSVGFTLVLAVSQMDTAWTYELGYETY